MPTIFRETIVDSRKSRRGKKHIPGCKFLPVRYLQRRPPFLAAERKYLCPVNHSPFEAEGIRKITPW